MSLAHAAAPMSRRTLLARAAAAGAFLGTRPAWAETVRLGLSGRPDERQITTDFPHRGPMILHRTRPQLLETPFPVFEQGVFTPNEVDSKALMN